MKKWENLLRVDLTSEKIPEQRVPEEVWKRYLGGGYDALIIQGKAAEHPYCLSMITR